MPIALTAVALAVLLSLPLAHLFELGGHTMCAPALLHFVVQGSVEVVVISGDAASLFPLLWMAVSALVPQLVLLIPRDHVPPLVNADVDSSRWDRGR